MLDLAWAAGIIEGEGSFTLESCGTSGRITVSQKDPELLYRLQALFGGSVKCRKPRSSNIYTNSDIYEWAVYGATAIGLMLTIFTWLTRRRRDQCRPIIEHLVQNSMWRRIRQCEHCGTDYMPWKRASTACSARCLSKLWHKKNTRTVAA